jgi:hypothetical protein
MTNFYAWLSIDSFVACLAIGSLPLATREIAGLSVVFGSCDAAGTLLGALIPPAISAPPAFATYLACACLLGIAARHSRGILYALPVVLSIDNMFSGAPTNLAPTLGLSSAAMALTGMLLAAACRRLVPGGAH